MKRPLRTAVGGCWMLLVASSINHSINHSIIHSTIVPAFWNLMKVVSTHQTRRRATTSGTNNSNNVTTSNTSGRTKKRTTGDVVVVVVGTWKIEKIVGAIIVLAIMAQIHLFFHLNIGLGDVGVESGRGKETVLGLHSGEEEKTNSAPASVTQSVDGGGGGGGGGRGGKNKNKNAPAVINGGAKQISTTLTNAKKIDNIIQQQPNEDKIAKDQGSRTTSVETDNSGNHNGNDHSHDRPKPQPNFKRYDKVAIVSKIHHPEDIFRLKKMLCFCMAAYNQYVNYDVVIFMTMPFTDEHVEDLRQAVAPSNLILARDGPSLEDHLASMTEDEQQFLFERCSVKEQKEAHHNVVINATTLSWYSHCKERDSDNISNLAYSWQSEFRAYHIYHHEALLKYKYMVWFDSDVQCAEPWPVDPMKTMVENDLAILFYNFPYGKVKNNLIKQKMKRAYGYEICGLKYDKHFIPSKCRTKKENVKINQIHGFHHITNLDFYRNETQQTLLKDMVSEYKFSRMWDDQIGVTLPAALGAPEKSWSYHDHGLDNITILHKEKPLKNIPGRIRDQKYDLRKYWYEEGGREKLPGGEKCSAFLTMH